MQIIPRPDNGRLEDPPISPDEIELHGGNYAAAPIRVGPKHPVAQVRELVGKAKQLEAEIAERTAVLNAEREKALACVREFEHLCNVRDDAAATVAQCASEIPQNDARLAYLEREIASWFGDVDFDLAAHVAEAHRREFMRARLPKYLATAKTELAAAEKAIEDFKVQNQFDPDKE